MSITLQTTSLMTDTPEPNFPKDDPLSREFGWSDVAAGLSRILIGYFLFFVFVVLAIGAVVWLMFQIAATMKANRGIPTFPVDPSLLLLIMGGVGGVGLWGWGMLLWGYYTCAMHAPERHGGRWFMFGGLLCAAIGPVINFVSASVDTPARPEPPAKKVRWRSPKQRQQAAQAAQFKSMVKRKPTATQIAGSIVNLTSAVLFVLFLRAIGSCFEAKALTVLVDAYLVAFALLVAFTLQMVFFTDGTQIPPLVALPLGLGWIGLGLWHLTLLIVARVTISVGLARKRSPLEAAF